MRQDKNKHVEEAIATTEEISAVEEEVIEEPEFDEPVVPATVDMNADVVDEGNVAALMAEALLGGDDVPFADEYTLMAVETAEAPAYNAETGIYNLNIVNANVAVRGEKTYAVNESGVIYVAGVDNCYHLNIGWKNGCCTVKGNSSCPFLGGNQQQCESFADRAETIARLKSVPRRQRRFGI